MSWATIRQKCPFCDEMLDYTVSSATDAAPNHKGGTTVTVHAQTTPASTAHVWTHAPGAETP